MNRVAGSFRRFLGSLQFAVKATTGEQAGHWSARTELGAGHCCRSYVTSASGIQFRYSDHSRIVEDQVFEQQGLKAISPSEHDSNMVDQKQRSDIEPLPKHRIGKNISPVEKTKFLVNTLLDLKDSKEAVFATLDAWVAWEQNFPLSRLKKALLVLEKQEQWHRVVQHFDQDSMVTTSF